MKTLIALLLALVGAAAAAVPPVVIENEHVRYTISAEGKNLGFVDRATGKDYLSGTVSPCAVVRRNQKEYPASSAKLAGGQLILQFGESGIEAKLKLEPRQSYIRLTVESISSDDIESLSFLNIALTLQGKPDEPFGACALSLNLITRVDQLPALQTELRAACYRKFGLVGAKVALIGLPMSQILPALKVVLSEADEMPLCKVAGPWAREISFNHGSYLFNFGSLTETNAGDWAEMAKSLGFTQIDNHGGSAFFRFGDFELNREKWPGGWDTYARIVARLHEAGIGSIFHTYAFFIDKHSRYVTPVPDPRLDYFRTFTLARELSAEADEIEVNETTASMSTVTGFFEHNSVLLHIDDELVTFGGASRQTPWRFSGVKRGVLGTKAAAHAAGTKARHLKECFGLLVPNPESSLFEEIAANHANVVNQSQFDGIYLDAIDGSSILRGGDECWYWADKFVFAIQKHLKKPVGMEMSAMWHHFWQYRTRWQAWDHPQRGHKRFIDLHAEAIDGGLLLPLHLGWWNFQAFNPPQVEPTYPDVLEYLGARLIGWDAGLSLTSPVDPERLRNTPLFRRAVDILRTCEEIRHSRTIDEAAKAKLREPGQEFALWRDQQGQARFRPSHSEAHTAALAEPWTLSWATTNPFPAQPLKLRLEVLMSAGPYDDPAAAVIGDFSEQLGTAWSTNSAAGVGFSLRPESRDSTAPTKSPSALFAAMNSGKVPRNGAWARCRKQFSPTLNLKERQALGLWIEGDGLGEVVAVRLESPQPIAFGAVADRYVTVDFTGRRLFTLIETESARWNDYNWNDNKGLYNVYRETIDFGAVESMSVWYQNLPPGKDVNCRLGPVKALPMVSAMLKDPVLTVNGIVIIFPIEASSGSWLECNGPDDCVCYGSKGEFLAKVTQRGSLSSLRMGKNDLQFSCTATKGPAPRAKVTVFSYGQPL